MEQYDKALPLDYSLFYEDKDYNEYRRWKITMFCDDLMKYKWFKEMRYLKKMQFLKDLETGCYNKTKERVYKSNVPSTWSDKVFRDIYHDICYDKCCNLSSELTDNKKFIQKIAKGQIKPIDIGKLESRDICPNYYAKIEEFIKLRSSVETKKKASSLYRCPKCRAFKVTIENRYNRSFDECTNLTITCVNCNYQWNG